MEGDIELNASGDLDARVIVSPSRGGRIRQIGVGDVGLLAAIPDDEATSTGWGLFPMAPWAGRVRNGRFHFMNRAIALDLNHEDSEGAGGGPIVPPTPAAPGGVAPEDRNRHAIHGTTFAREWSVDSVRANQVEMRCDLRGSLGWPFDGIARQVISLSSDRVDLMMTVESVDGSVFPATVGWHPWFAKPDRLEFSPIAMYEKDDIGLPSGRLIPPSTGPWDDCFVNHETVTLHYDRDVVSTVTVASPADHWVVFDALDIATCVEPQTGPPDAPNIRPQLVAPGSPLRTTMSISWR